MKRHFRGEADGLNRMRFKLKICQMPALRHWVGKELGEAFRAETSEVTSWLVEQIESQGMLFDIARGTGLIVYDRERNVWMGKESAGGIKFLAIDPLTSGVASPPEAA